MEYDLSKVQWSPQDLSRGIVIPTVPSIKLAELIGIIIGDGYLHAGKNKYTIGIVGGIEKEGEYFVYVLKLLKIVFNVEPKIRSGSRALRIVFGSKAIFTFLTRVVGLDYGRGKGQRVTIPDEFCEVEMRCALLRGLFDTDGTIFVSKKPGILNYPSMEFATTSGKLALQVRSLLLGNGFRVSNVRKFVYKRRNFLDIYRVGLYGRKNALEWHDKIGFSNPVKQFKLEKIVNGDAGI